MSHIQYTYYDIKLHTPLYGMKSQFLPRLEYQSLKLWSDGSGTERGRGDGNGSGSGQKDRRGLREIELRKWTGRDGK